MEQIIPYQEAVRKNKTNGASLKASKKILLTVTDHAPDVICRFDKMFRLLYVNPAIERASGIPTHMFINKTTRDLGMPEQHSQDWEQGVAFVFTYGKQTTLEFPFMTPSGLRHFHSLLVPEFDKNGNIETVLSISRDITEMKEQEKRKEEIVGMVSHELKTPITSLKIFSQVLQQRFTKVGDMNTAQHLAKMDVQIDKLTNIIGDLTEATRIENNTLKMQRKAFDFDLFVKEIVEEIQKTTSIHTITIQGKVGRKISADKFRIGQVLTNLLTNAIKYSPKSSEIIVTLSINTKNVICSVQDCGVGIPKIKQKKVFERFYRVHDTQQKTNLGLGLGLYISSEIIKKHHGRIWVKSEGNRKSLPAGRQGSTFSFSLPLK